MKYYEMSDVYHYVIEDLIPEETPSYRRYQQAMDHLLQALKPYFDPDAQGNYKAIDEEDYQRISALFDEATSASNDFIHSYDNIIEPENKYTPPIKDVAVNLNDEFLSKAYVEFKAIKPSPHFSLKEQMDHFRYTSVQTTSEEFQTLAGNQSSRTKMTVELNGEKVEGVFTPITMFDGKSKIAEILPRMMEKHSKYKAFFANIDLDNFYQVGIRNSRFNLFFDKEGNAFQGNDAVQAVTQYVHNMQPGQKALKIANKYFADPDFYNACMDFAMEIDKVRTPIVINRDNVSIQDGDRIDSRNSAMSAVASLIGCPHVIAASRPLVIYDEKTHEYREGTFMEFAKGKDINALDAVDELRIINPSQYESASVKEQLADLQVLDYICGNVDRHAGNIVYNYDPQTQKVIGITGIDNDSSFMKQDIDTNGQVIRLPGANRLRVINERMAKTISSLTEGQLRATLHGYGLDQEAVDAAWKRTLQLKETIANATEFSTTGKVSIASPIPSITIMKKEDWDKVDLIHIHYGHNNTVEAYDQVAHSMYKRETMDKKTKARYVATMKGLSAAIGKSQTGFLYQKVKDASPWFFASVRYKNLMAKVKEYHEEPLGDKEDPLSPANDKKYEKLDELKSAIAVYKSEKVRDGFIDENWNVKRGLSGKDLDRVNLVKDMEAYVARIEKEKEVAAATRLSYQAEEKRIADVNDFLQKDYAEQEALIAAKQEKAVEQQKEENVIEATSVKENINASVPDVKADGHFLKAEEVKEPKLEEENQVEAAEVEKEEAPISL